MSQILELQPSTLRGEKIRGEKFLLTGKAQNCFKEYSKIDKSRKFCWNKLSQIKFLVRIFDVSNVPSPSRLAQAFRPMELRRDVKLWIRCLDAMPRYGMHS